MFVQDSATTALPRQAWALVAGLLVGACGGPPDSVIEPGIVEYFEFKPMIDAPELAAAGVAFQVSVTTYGGGCISFEGTDVAEAEDGADIYVYDRRRIPAEDEACVLILEYIPHETSLSFVNPGTKVIRIHGRKLQPPNDELIELTREVTVQ